MTKISPEVIVKMPMEAFPPVSAVVSFVSDSFPKYKIGPDNQIVEEPMEENHGPSLKDVIDEEVSNLSDQHKRLSVRDLATKFDKNFAAAAKLSDGVLLLFIFMYLSSKSWTLFGPHVVYLSFVLLIFRQS